MKVKTNIKVGSGWQDALESVSETASSTLNSLSQNPAVHQAGQAAKKLWYWPFPTPM